ncbi:MAG: family 10 glycosylhydrolase [Muribaculaceae bacterium]|nr:family 10 glycosylhydrolase [Muribaculaceae bacterium]
MRKIATTVLAAAAIALMASSCGSKKSTAEVTETESKPALMWVDAEANYARFNHPDTIDKYVDMLADLGFTHLAVDARPITGELMYDSELAPRFKGIKNDIEPMEDFDYLGYFVKKAHEKNMKVLFSLNVFCAGHNYFDRGLIYEGHPEWASIVQDPVRGLVPITEQKEKYGAMVNPINPEYQTYIIDVMKEMITKYPEVDGLILDRGRYDGIAADFSDLSRAEFEKFIGNPIENFPADILEIVRTENGRDSIIHGPLFNDWVFWRSKNITDFFAKARKELKEVNPNTIFSTYSGAWYPSYYEVGVNFASNQYDPSKDFSWAREDYKETGYAELIDLYITGNYYTDITIEDFENNPDPIWNETDFEGHSGDWYCVEGSCKHLREILGPNKFLGGVLVDQLYGNPERFSESMAMNTKESDGLMIFDIVHIINANLWDELKKGMELSGFITPQAEEVEVAEKAAE